MTRRDRWLAVALLGGLLGGLLVSGCAGGRRGGKEGRTKVDYRVVKPAVAFTLLQDNESLIVIDLRTEAAYAGPDGHINGAVNIPLDELSDRLQGLHPLRRRTFLVYCDGGDCGPRGMRLLSDHGFRYVVLMDGGLPEWKAEGFGVVYGPDRRVP